MRDATTKVASITKNVCWFYCNIWKVHTRAYTRARVYVYIYIYIHIYIIALNKHIRISVFTLEVLTRLQWALRLHCSTQEIRPVSYNLQTDHPKKYDLPKYDITSPRGLCTVPCKFTISVAYEPRKRMTWTVSRP